MTVCYKCGDEISFAEIDGVVRPIHSGGGCSGGSGIRSVSWGYSISRYAGQDFTWKTKCPKCDASVFFVRHNGGSVWFDPPLGWPWYKHGCFDYPSKRKYSQNLREIVEGLSKESLSGVVILVLPVPGKHHSIAAIECTDNKGRCIKLRGNPNELNERLVFFDLKRDAQKLFVLGGEEYKILELIDPKTLGFTKVWAEDLKKVSGSILQRKPPKNL